MRGGTWEIFRYQFNTGSFYLTLVLLPGGGRIWRSFSIILVCFSVRSLLKTTQATAEKLTHQPKLLDSIKGLIQKASHKFIGRVHKNLS